MSRCQDDMGLGVELNGDHPVRTHGATPDRRSFLAGMAVAAGAAMLPQLATAQTATDAPVNLALTAEPSSKFFNGVVSALNSGAEPANSADATKGMFGTWPQTDKQWVQYDWKAPVTIDRVDVYWWVDGRGIGLPKSWHVEYWTGSRFKRVQSAQPTTVLRDSYNSAQFDPITTDRLRLVVEGDGKLSIGILQWRVWGK